MCVYVKEQVLATSLEEKSDSLELQQTDRKVDIWQYLLFEPKVEVSFSQNIYLNSFVFKFLRMTTHFLSNLMNSCLFQKKCISHDLSINGFDYYS